MLDLKKVALVAGMALLTSTVGASAQSRSGGDRDVYFDVDRGDTRRTNREMRRDLKDLRNPSNAYFDVDRGDRRRTHRETRRDLRDLRGSSNAYYDVDRGDRRRTNRELRRDLRDLRDPVTTGSVRRYEGRRDRRDRF